LSEAAVAEPEVKPTAEVIAPEPTEGIVNDAATEPDATIQTDATKVPADEETPLARAMREGAQADLQALIKEEAAKLLAAEKGEQRKATARETLKAQFQEMAEELGLAPDDQPSWNAVNKLHLKALGIAEAAHLEEYAELIAAKFPEASRAKFIEAVGGKPIDEWVTEAAELLAPTTKAHKAALQGMSLEDFAKVSKQGREDLKKAIEDARDLGRPAGEVRGQERGSAASGLTLAQIDAMPMSQWRNYPKPERDRLLAEARRT
jgi:hypothetical protein